MLNFTIFREDSLDNYKVNYTDSFGAAIGPLELPLEYIASITSLENYLRSIKTPKELAFEYVKTYATDEEKLQMISIYPSYAVGKSYEVNSEFQYQNQLYRVLQAHTSQADWIPNTTPALYLKIEPAGVVPEWVQPTGAQDAYNIGDHAMFEGQEYVSLIDANTWSPTAYPAGWELVVS